MDRKALIKRLKLPEWDEAGYQKPKIQNDSPRGWFTLEMPFIEKGSGKTTQETTQETTRETTREIILNVIKNKPEITRNELADICGITPDGIKYHLDKLRQNGKIRHVGPTKKGRWEIIE